MCVLSSKHQINLLITEKNTHKNWLPHFLILPLCLNIIFITMKNGTVKFFNESKGFGFVIDDADNQEYFVHVTGLIDEINEGDKVEFDLKDGRKGLNAVDVKIID